MKIAAKIQFYERVNGVCWGFLYNMFPAMVFVLFMINGGTLTLVTAIVGKDYMERVFHCLNWLPHQLDWRDELFIWEDKVVKFCSIPNMQKGLRTTQPK